MQRQISRLCRRLPEKDFAIERFLEDTAIYAETSYAAFTYADSVVDEDDLEHHASSAPEIFEPFSAQQAPSIVHSPTSPLPAPSSLPRPKSPGHRPVSSRQTPTASSPRQGPDTVPPEPPSSPLLSSVASSNLDQLAPVEVDQLIEAREGARRNRQRLNEQQNKFLDSQLYNTVKRRITDDIQELLK